MSRREFSMLTGRQKIEAAFTRDGSREFAAAVCWEDVFVRDHWGQLTATPWYDQYSPDLERQMAWRSKALARTGQDLLIVPSFYSRQEREHLTIVDRPEGVFLIDQVSSKRKKLEPPIIGGWSQFGQMESASFARLPTTPDEFEVAVALPAPVDTERIVADGRADLACALLQAHGTELYPITEVYAPLWYLYELWGFEGMMTLIGERPDLVERACPHLTARTLAAVREAAILGAAGVWIWESFTDMISPQAYEAFSVPGMRRVVEECRHLGIKSIYNFSGNPAGKLDAILSVGADALALEESKKDFVVDINELAAYADGRCTLFGNLDAIGILQNGSDPQLRDAITEQIAAGRRNQNRFVVCLGSPVTPSTPVDRVRLYCDLAREMSHDR